MTDPTPPIPPPPPPPGTAPGRPSIPPLVTAARPSGADDDGTPDATPSRPRRPRRCAQCGYDLTGIPASGSAQCPECGHTLDDADSRRTREHAFFRRFGWWVALGALVTIGAVVAMTVFLGDRAALFAVPLVLLLFGWLPFVLVARLTRDME